MAENESNVQNGVSSADDTKTRKTVRLRPSGTPLPKVPAEGISDPLSARDTDTSNLEILDDTQTRRTVKIKPLAPPTPGSVKLPLDSENTNTRKTVVLRPQATGTDGENTNTRRTVVLRPVSSAAPTAPAAPVAPATPAVEVSDETVAVVKPKVEAPVVPVPINPAPAAEVSDETVAVAKPKPAVAPGVDISAADEDDRTVKVKRPTAPPRIGPRPMGAPLPKGGIGARPGMPGLKPAVPASPAAPAASAAPAAEDESSKETVKLPQPARPAPVAAPKPAPAPVAAPKPAPAPVAAPAVPKEAEAEKKNDSADDEIVLAPSEKAKKEKPEAENASVGKEDGKNNRMPASKQAASVANSASPLYLILGIITLILLLGVTAFTLTQYLDFEQKIKVYEHVPGLPHAK
jgi:hypothetical protein